ncbi:MAG: hypothetical protein ABI151_08920 [Chitinophagaceae bacterium]
MILTWINRRSDPILELQLTEDGEILESLQLNPVQESIRIRCEGYHQVFFLNNSKASQDQVIFTNAYGIEAGILKFNDYPLLSGTVTLENQAFLCTHNSSSNSLTMCNTSLSENRVSVLLPLEDNLPLSSIPVANKRLEMDAAMLLSICWNMLKKSQLLEVSASGRLMSSLM